MKKNVGQDITFDGSFPITVKFAWEQYKKQHSTGLISGLIEKAESSVDCDASAFVIKENAGKLELSYSIDYTNLASEDGSIVHEGDNIDADSSPYDEKIRIDFSKLDPSVKEIVFTLDLLKEKRHFLLGKLEHTRICVYNTDTKEKIGEYSIVGTGDKALQVGRLVRDNSSWILKAEVVDIKGVSDRTELSRAIEF